MKVAVIVDDLDPDRRRRCFWPEQLDAMPDIEYELISLLEKMEERKFFDVYAYDIMYASDRVQDIVAFYDDHFVQFVQRGGILIMENQPKRWRPVQQAYEILLGSEVKVISRDNFMFGSKATVSKRLHSHPLFQHMPVAMHSAYAHSPSESWFPDGSTSPRSIQELNPTKIYSGAFRSWSSDWLPLMYTDEGQYPIMLLKTEGLGLWVVTTMYLASSNMRELLDSLIIGSRRHMIEIRQYHQRQKLVRKLAAVRVVALLLGLGALIYLILASHVITANIPYGNTVAGNIAFSIVLTIILSVLTFARKYVRQSLSAVLNK
jgi:hypothetical protein